MKLRQCVSCVKRDCHGSVIFVVKIYELLVYDIVVSVIEIIFYFVIIGDVFNHSTLYFLQMWCIQK